MAQLAAVTKRPIGSWGNPVVKKKKFLLQKAKEAGHEVFMTVSSCGKTPGQVNFLLYKTLRAGTTSAESFCCTDQLAYELFVDVVAGAPVHGPVVQELFGIRPAPLTPEFQLALQNRGQGPGLTTFTLAAFPKDKLFATDGVRTLTLIAGHLCEVEVIHFEKQQNKISGVFVIGKQVPVPPAAQQTAPSKTHCDCAEPELVKQAAAQQTTTQRHYDCFEPVGLEQQVERTVLSADFQQKAYLLAQLGHLL